MPTGPVLVAETGQSVWPPEAWLKENKILASSAGLVGLENGLPTAEALGEGLNGGVLFPVWCSFSLRNVALHREHLAFTRPVLI